MTSRHAQKTFPSFQSPQPLQQQPLTRQRGRLAGKEMRNITIGSALQIFIATIIVIIAIVIVIPTASRIHHNIVLRALVASLCVQLLLPNIRIIFGNVTVKL